MGILSSLFGIGGSKPSTSTVVQQQNIPPELAPFIKEILGEAQTLYKSELERGYDPYTGLTTAPFTPEQEAAQEGISGLVGTTAPFLAEAFDIYKEGGEKFTPEVAQEYMSPYQRAVTDIEKREAQRQFERTARPTFEKRAVDAGGMSGLGTRAGVEAAEMQRGQSQLLADIEAKGLQSAFRDAQQQFAQQKAREQQMAGNIGRTGPALFQAGLAERGAQMGVGEQKREAAQSELDEAYFKFLEERGFPQQTLTDYSQTVYGSPLSKQPFGTTRTETGTPFVSSPGSQLMGLGLGGLNIYGMAGGWGAGGPSMQGLYSGGRNPLAKEGGQVIPREGGGQINSRGLSGLPIVRRQENDQVGNPQASRINPLAVPLIQSIYPFALSMSQNLPSTGSKQPFGLTSKIPTITDIQKMLGKGSTGGYFFDTAAKQKAYEAQKKRRANLLGYESGDIADIITDKLEAIKGKRGDYYEEALEETEKIDIGGGVGEELKKERPEGETPIQLLTKVMGAAAQTAGEQGAEGRKERARLKEKRIGEDVALLESTATQDIAAVSRDTKNDIAEMDAEVKHLIEMAELPMKEQQAIIEMYGKIATARGLFLKPYEIITKVISAIGSVTGKTGTKNQPSFLSELKYGDVYAANRTTGARLFYNKDTDSYTVGGIDGTPLKTNSPAAIEFERLKSKYTTAVMGAYFGSIAKGNDPRLGMSIAMEKLMGEGAYKIYKRQLDDRAEAKKDGITILALWKKKYPRHVSDLKANPTSDMKKQFDESFGPGAAAKVLADR